MLNHDLLTPSTSYCTSLTDYVRCRTRVVDIGGVPLGGDNPIRVQSMTTTDTLDTEGTIAQSIRMIEAGSEYVRITAPSQNEARNLENIKKGLRDRGYDAPLVADIHFTPNAAEIAARIVEKVRVNPGNYADKKRFNVFEFSDDEYASELDRIREKFSPLVKICKEHGTAMRIGTNHGSLSDRIMNRFGDTPLGMVESALEFVRICRDLDYHDIVLSMKASNTKVMVQAYRLLVRHMQAEEMDYPLHLGVTEAGDGEDGRIKSAVGIGALLEDGLGDTIRVSLTEEPEAEIPVARALVARYANRGGHPPIAPIDASPVDPCVYGRRETTPVAGFGAAFPPGVIATLPRGSEIGSHLDTLGYKQSNDGWVPTDSAADYVFVASEPPGGIMSSDLPDTLGVILDGAAWLGLSNRESAFPLFALDDFAAADIRSPAINFVLADAADVLTADLSSLTQSPAVLVLSTSNAHAMPAIRRAFFHLLESKVDVPVIIRGNYAHLTDDQRMLHSASDLGALLNDGLGDGAWLEAADAEPRDLIRIAFGILQATRTRISRTEYIACPSCGRTQFDLMETTALIRSRTSHLKGLNIGIMGCIVNGPGEMADADFGYVGSGPGKITLYRGKDIVERNLDATVAVDALIDLIKADGRWVEP